MKEVVEELPLYWMVTAAALGRLHVTTADRLVTSLTSTLEGGVGGSGKEGQRQDKFELFINNYKVMTD